MTIQFSGETETNETFQETICSRFDLKRTSEVREKLKSDPTLTATMQVSILSSMDGKRTITLLTTEINESIYTPFNIKVRAVNGESIDKTIEELLCCSALAEKMEALERCDYPSDLDFSSLLLQAGFLEVVEEPKKFFALFDTTPEQMALRDDTSSVNEILAKSLSHDGWEPAITVSVKEILEYLRKTTA
ncbi:hypothetical protein P7F88_03845 [Vibrio hannami]|uniref:hypothetical protein n=1 Tax=Vibrio hannami TaxID=2717094 RepID=UPI00241062A2|nr:hypothetical protein [Vibrio hannami]MDG3085280.1 hypothetical protein [Vibrio hannami]